MADINDYSDGFNYNLSDDEKFLMDIFAESWEYCREGHCDTCEYRSDNKYCKMLLCMSYQYSKRLIAADVAPVRHGHWIAENTRLKSVLYICSVCGETAHDRPYGSSKWVVKKCKMKYCPNCGAKMENGEEND